MSIRCDIVSGPAVCGKISNRRLAIVIPVFNEARHIGDLLEACRVIEPALIVVVDDCSSDATPLICKHEAKENRSDVELRVIRCGHNLGKQGAVKKGLRALRDQDLDAVAIIDGDGQHDPAELPALVSLLDDYDFVIGARSPFEMPVQRRFSNWLVNTGFRLIAGVDFVDVQSGLRVYRKELADALGERLEEEGGFALEHESLAVLASYGTEITGGLRAAATPISCKYGKAKSSIKTLHILQLGYETIRQALRLRDLCTT